jgi:hypothetical protein
VAEVILEVLFSFAVYEPLAGQHSTNGNANTPAVTTV